MKEKQKYLFNYIYYSIFHIKAFIFLQIIKVILNECFRDIPIRLKNGSCVLKYCKPEEYNSKECIIDNPIVKTQYLNDIIMFGEKYYMYIDFITFSSKDMIVVTSLSPDLINEKRIFYGLKENGEYFFKKDNSDEESPFYSLPTTDSKLESANSIFTKNGKEYFLSIGRLSEAEIYDFENKEIYHIEASNLFPYLNSNMKGNLLILNKDMNRYLYNIIYSLSSTDISAIFLRFDLNLNDDNSLSFSNSKEIKKTSFGEISSCFMIESKEIIVCFYGSINNDNKYYYSIIAFDYDLNELKDYMMDYTKIGERAYFYSFYFREEAGAFIYYKYLNEESEVSYPFIFFKKFNCETNIFEDYFSENNSILLDKYIFESYYTINDFIKISDSKIGLFCTSSMNDILYIIILNTFSIDNSNNIKVRYYSIEYFKLYYLLLLNNMKAYLYKDFIILGLNSSPSGSFEDSNSNFYTELIIFGYPNGTNFEINIIDDLLINNNSTIDNLIIDMSEYLQIDNNIFGYVYDGIEINDINSLGYIFLVSSISNTIFDFEDNNVVNKEEKIKINFTNNFYLESEYNFEYSYIVTEPEYEEYDYYPINITTSYVNENKEIFDESKRKYKGKLINGKIFLNEKLTKECETNCNLCFTNKTCITYKPIMDINTVSESTEIAISESTEITLSETIEITMKETSKSTIYETSKITGIQETTQVAVTIIPEISERITSESVKNTLISEVIEMHTHTPKITQTVSEYNMENSESKNYYITEAISTKTQKTEKLIENKTCENQEIINNHCKNFEIGNQQIKEIYNNLVKEITQNKTNAIIKTKNVKFQIASIEDLKQTEDNEISSIDLGECENILKQVNRNPLKVLKIDFKSDDLSSTYVQYEVYDILTGNKIDLIICKDTPIKISVPKILDEETLNIYNNLNSLGYNLFNSNDSFYNDICSTYTSSNKKDMLLSDRWEDIYIPNNEKYMCQSGCKLIDYNITNQKADCECFFQKQDVLETLENIKFDKREILETFVGTLKNSNFMVLKCGHLLINNFSKNYGCIIMAAIVILILILMIIYFIIGPKYIKRLIDSIIYKKFKLQDNKSKKLKNKKGKNKKFHETKIATNKSKIKNNKNHKNKKRIDTNNTGTKKVIKDKLDKENKNGNKKKNKKYHFPPKKHSKFKNNEENLSSMKKRKLDNITNKSNNSKNSLLNNKKIIVYSKKLIGNNEVSKSKYTVSENHKLFDLKPRKNDKILITNNNEINKNKHFVILNDEELNNLEYLLALKYDKRTYFQYYCTLLKKKQLILFSFFPNTDFNLIPLKISLFLMSFTIYFTIHGFFFSDETMHKIYEDSSAFNIINQIPVMLYSTIVSTFLNMLLKQLSLSEKSILTMNQEKDYSNAIKKSNRIQKCLKIKFFLFFLISFIILSFCWYFISCFCLVYVNTQVILISDTFISFGLSMLYPFGLNLMPGLFRIPALRAKKKDKRCLYKLSNIIALI